MVKITNGGAFEPTSYIPPKPEPEPVDIDTSTPSMNMTDEEIRIVLVDTYLEYDIPIIPYMDLVYTTTWSNLANRTKFINEIKHQIILLASQENGVVNQTEKTRIGVIVKNIAKIKEVYEEAEEFREERLKEDIENFFEDMSLPTKIIAGVGIGSGILFGAFVFYNFLKSYGTEKGKIKARS